LEERLLERLAPRLKQLRSGGYAREYRWRGRTYRSSLHSGVAEILDAVGAKAKEDVTVPGTSIRADFEVAGRFVFVDRSFDDEELRELRRQGRRCVLIRVGRRRSDRFDAGIRVVELDGDAKEDPQTIFIDDPSFSFDYAHILPQTQKCSVMHGHTSSVLVEIVGTPVEGMVVDFGDAKDIVRAAVRGLDHKLFINRKYVTAEDKASVTLRFRTVHGEFAIRAPKATTVLLDGEATVENLTSEVLGRIAPEMPGNVTAVGVYVYEGLNKGSHLLAYLHGTRGESPRRRR
jgi:6-pyruvoyltetrahydropterin/6-carboxytetrahydropterin synthase